ncbi:MAG TPA: hypothetical protein VM144_04490 [Aestuariivirga sp.]|nr:hypothetical protein [Aestuariivirga sp.]
MKFKKGEKQAAVAAIEDLLFDSVVRFEEQHRVKKRDKPKHVKNQQPRRGRRRKRYEVLQQMYEAVMEISKFAEGPTEDLQLNNDLCDALNRIVRGGFHKVFNRSEIDSKRQMLNRYSSALRWAWMNEISVENFRDRLDEIGGIDKALRKWRSVKENMLNQLAYED